MADDLQHKHKTMCLQINNVIVALRAELAIQLKTELSESLQTGLCKYCFSIQ